MSLALCWQQQEATMRSALTLSALLLSVSLAGCVVAPIDDGGYYAYQAPPPPRYEVVGVAPAPGFFWIGGGWYWERGGYNWHPGRWEARRPGYAWAPQRWSRQGNRWVMHEGHWARR
ncbi:MAG: YXWGXW repeat-containing protein [Gammaproteobacteria bacterium]|nr:YXWGXW repeat-containing protein [Gammaproteobacteria bacterium]MBV9697600.1 YXWGXW repeat-containing protein [Gammaproteobacteria bacterium]